MRELFLVGMAPPVSKKGEYIGDLKDDLVPLDPRHGVFPNLVMTPLLSGLMFLKTKNEQIEFIKMVRRILEQQSTNRLNVFESIDKKKNNPFSHSFKKLMMTLRPDHHICVIFGFWSSNAAIRYVLDGPTSECNYAEIRQFSEEFLSSAGFNVPKELSARTGITLRITRKIADNNQEQIRRLTDKYEEEKVRKLAAIIPLLHNEAYQLPQTGLCQRAFMNANIFGDFDRNQIPPKQYWEFIGEEIALRFDTRTN